MSMIQRCVLQSSWIDTRPGEGVELGTINEGCRKRGTPNENVGILKLWLQTSSGSCTKRARASAPGSNLVEGRERGPSASFRHARRSLSGGQGLVARYGGGGADVGVAPALRRTCPRHPLSSPGSSPESPAEVSYESRHATDTP